MDRPPEHEDQTGDREELPRRRRLLRGLMLAVAAWGSFLALGAFLFGYDPQTGAVRLAPNLLRGGIVLLCLCAFLGGWYGLARRRFE